MFEKSNSLDLFFSCESLFREGLFLAGLFKS